LGQYIAANGSDGFNNTSNTPEGAYLFKPDHIKQYQEKYGYGDWSPFFWDLQNVYTTNHSYFTSH
jgi:hypothetical protein